MSELKNRVKGLSHFSEYFREDKDTFVIIGGIATMFSLESAGIQARATKDIDLVILTNPNISFADKLKHYVGEGGYEINVGGEEGAKNYRFRKPINDAFPEQLEIFSSVVFNFNLAPDQKIIPIETSSGLGSLSAILMDQDYFSLVRSDVQSIDEIPVLGVSSLIPLKARAFLDLSKRKKDGESVDSRDIKKHRNDVFKLIASLPEDNFVLADSIKLDLSEFFIHEEILKVQESAIGDIVGLSLSMEEIIETGKRYYKLA